MFVLFSTRVLLCTSVLSTLCQGQGETCLSGFPSYDDVTLNSCPSSCSTEGLNGNNQQLRIFPTMMITCNGALQGVTVAGEFGGGSQLPELQIWRPSSGDSSTFNKETSLTYQFPNICTTLDNNIQQCSLDTALPVRIGDVIAILLTGTSPSHAEFQVYFSGTSTTHYILPSTDSTSYPVTGQQSDTGQPLIYLDIMPVPVTTEPTTIMTTYSLTTEPPPTTQPATDEMTTDAETTTAPSTTQQMTTTETDSIVITVAPTTSEPVTTPPVTTPQVDATTTNEMGITRIETNSTMPPTEPIVIPTKPGPGDPGNMDPTTSESADSHHTTEEKRGATSVQGTDDDEDVHTTTFPPTTMNTTEADGPGNGGQSARDNKIARLAVGVVIAVLLVVLIIVIIVIFVIWSRRNKSFKVKESVETSQTHRDNPTHMIDVDSTPVLHEGLPMVNYDYPYYEQIGASSAADGHNYNPQDSEIYDTPFSEVNCDNIVFSNSLATCAVDHMHDSMENNVAYGTCSGMENVIHVVENVVHVPTEDNVAYCTFNDRIIMTL